MSKLTEKTREWRSQLVSTVPPISGIYAIICQDKYYIGASINIRNRIKEHLYMMTISREHHSMAEDFSKYGEGSISVEILEEVHWTKLRERELYWQAQFEETYNKEAGKRHRSW